MVVKKRHRKKLVRRFFSRLAEHTSNMYGNNTKTFLGLVGYVGTCDTNSKSSTNTTVATNKTLLLCQTLYRDSKTLINPIMYFLFAL